MKAMAWFFGSVVAIVLVSGVVLAIPFSSAQDRGAIRWSALVAVIAQLFAFAIARAFGTRSFLAGWVVGVVLRFATLVVYGIVAVRVLAIPFSSSPDREAIRSSALVAVIAQVFAFAIAKAFGTRSFLAGWVVGVALRFATLVVYGIVAVKVLALPAPAALISLVTFLFLSTLAETKLLAL